ncbi:MULTISPECIES: hypothetical protein [Methylomonas]|uniref:hypothetical protein n=1 Tax=Methylomonas TaxID=416 RepID=UPI003306F652
MLGMSGHWLSVFFGLALILLVGSGLRHSLPIIKPRYHRGAQQQNNIRSDL